MRHIHQFINEYSIQSILDEMFEEAEHDDSCADISKAFDTVRFKLVLEKMHTMGFFEQFSCMDD